MKNEKKYKGVYLDSKTGKYYVSTTFVTIDGIEVKKCKRGFATQREANNWKEDQRVFYSKSYYSSSGACKTKNEALIDKYLNYKTKFVKPKTMDSIKKSLNNEFIAYFKDTNLSDLKPLDIQEYYLWLSDKKTKNQSKNVSISYILGFIEWLDLMELINPSVARKFKLIVVRFEIVEESKNDYLEPDEMQRLLDSYGSTRDEKMQKLMITAFCYSGLRHSEMRALQYKDIDIVNHTISVNKQLLRIGTEESLQESTKTNKNRIVDIPLFLVEMFMELQQIDNASPEDFIFTIKGKVIHEAANLQRFNHHLKKAGVKKVCIHDLRHTYLSMLIEAMQDHNIVDIKYASSQAGHTTTKTTQQVYEHITDARKSKNKELIELLKN